MIIYYDTEFTNLDGSVDWDMISAGFVAEDGREWYAEITDFDREACSDFVIETVLPLLEGTPEQCRRRTQFADGLLAWLRTFDEPIELVADARCDWSLLQIYAGKRFKELPHPVISWIWEMTTLEETQQALEDAEQHFWDKHFGMQHHALYDARNLKLLAELQRQLLTSPTGPSRSPA